MKQEKPVPMPTIYFEGYGSFQDKSGLPLAAYQTFNQLDDCRRYVAMLKRGGCKNVSIHKVIQSTPTKKYVRVKK